MQHIVHFFKACLRLISNVESNYKMLQYYHQVETSFQLTKRLLIGRSISKELTKSRRVRMSVGMSALFSIISASGRIPQIHYSRVVCLSYINFLLVHVKLTPAIVSVR